MSKRSSLRLLVLLVAAAVAAGFAVREPDPMAVAAAALLDSLDDAQRDAMTFAFTDAERRHWQPVPMGTAGVRLDAMNDEQRKRVHALLSSALSENGLATVEGVRVLEGVLVAMEADRGRPSRFHGQGRYHITIYGDPSGDAPWGWRMEGHHLSMTFTSVSGEWTAHGPLFVGSQPARVRGGEHDGFRLLGHKDDNIRALLASLDEKQRAIAVSTGRLPGNVILTPGKDDGFETAQGLAGKDMTEPQRAALLAALYDWADWLRVDLAEAEKKHMQAGLGETHFMWMGETGVDAPHYWRITGPHFAIEYAAPENDPDHVHALWRDVNNDFGDDLLRKHLEEDHGGSALSDMVHHEH